MRKKEGLNWELSPEENVQIRLDWAKKVVKHSKKVENFLIEQFNLFEKSKD